MGRFINKEVGSGRNWVSQTIVVVFRFKLIEKVDYGSLGEGAVRCSFLTAFEVLRRRLSCLRPADKHLESGI